MSSFQRRPGGPRGPGPGGPRRGPRPPRPDQPQSSGPGGRPHLAKDELRYHGRNACLALWKMRPKEVVRVYVKEEMADQFADLLTFCSQHRKSYHLVSDMDLERLTDTKHHEGICVVAKEKRAMNAQELFRELTSGRTLILYLDGVGNPHNLGAILRTASHFGLRYVAGSDLPRLSPSAARVAEGGAEHLSLVDVENPAAFFERLQGQGFQVYAFDPGEKAVSLFDTRLAEKAVFVMGAEVTGLSGLIRAIADLKITIPGTGVVESLNVSVAAALALAEFHRQGNQRSVRIVKTKS